MVDPAPLVTLGGVELVLARLKARLEAQVPVEFALLNDLQGRPVPAATPGEDEAVDWRAPQLYAISHRGRLEPDDYPAVMLVPQATRASRVIGMEEGRPVRVVTYSVRLWLLLRFWGFDEVQAARNRLATVIKQALYRQQHLGDGTTLLVDGWVESYSEADIDDDDGRSAAGWWVEFPVEQEERITDPELVPGPKPTELELVVHPEAD